MSRELWLNFWVRAIVWLGFAIAGLYALMWAGHLPAFRTYRLDQAYLPDALRGFFERGGRLPPFGSPGWWFLAVVPTAYAVCCWGNVLLLYSGRQFPWRDAREQRAYAVLAWAAALAPAIAILRAAIATNIAK